MKYLKWALLFIPSLFVEIICYILAPLVAFLITKEWREDYVKRFGKTVNIKREYLLKYVYWFQTHDNAVDEWWYGLYNNSHWFKFARDWTQLDYEDKYWVRYYCRVMWLWRNCGYGFLYNLFSAPVESALSTYTYGTKDKSFWYNLDIFKSSFQLELQIPLGKRYFSMNIGNKAHKTFPRKMYANRIIGFRKYKT